VADHDNDDDDDEGIFNSNLTMPSSFPTCNADFSHFPCNFRRAKRSVQK